MINVIYFFIITNDMGYTNCLTIGQMKEMDILDEVPYKYIKNHHDDDDIEVNIYHTNDADNRPTYSTIVFEYSFEYDYTKKFKTKITYNTSSPFALFLCGIQEDTDEEEIDIVFNCANCGEPIERNSPEHDECITRNDKDWYCGDCHDRCHYEEESDEDTDN